MLMGGSCFDKDPIASALYVCVCVLDFRKNPRIWSFSTFSLVLAQHPSKRDWVLACWPMYTGTLWHGPPSMHGWWCKEGSIQDGQFSPYRQLDWLFCDPPDCGDQKILKLGPRTVGQREWTVHMEYQMRPCAQCIAIQKTRWKSKIRKIC